MNDEIKNRPLNATQLFESSAFIAARPNRIFEVLSRRLDPGAKATSKFFADQSDFRVIAQGGKWYRAEYQIVPSLRGCLIEHRLFDVSGRANDLPKSVQRVIEIAPTKFGQLVELLKAELE